MSHNVLILNAGGDAPRRAAEKAAASGDELGLVQTRIALGKEKVSGGRIEEDREFGGVTFQTFDEPVFIGSAIAQLCGHADAVIVDSLDTWGERLVEAFKDDDVALDAEILSLTSVLRARMADLILVAQTDRTGLNERVCEIVLRVIEMVRPHCDSVEE